MTGRRNTILLAVAILAFLYGWGVCLPCWGQGRTTNRLGDESFARSGVAYAFDVLLNVSRQEFASLQPRVVYRATAPLSDLALLGDEGGINFVPRGCDSTGRLIATNAADATKFYTSTDGATWSSQLASPTTAIDYCWPVAYQGQSAFIVSRNNALSRLVWDGSKFTDTAVLTLTTNAAGFYYSLHQAANGTIIFAEYGTSATVKMYRSTDGGSTWATVHTFDTDSIRHVHCVTKHEATGIWVATTGDYEAGTQSHRQRLTSTDDGVTWVADAVLYPFQHVQLFDYGDATRLLTASDSDLEIGLMTLGTQSEPSLLQMLPRGKSTGYVWSIFRHQGVYYASQYDNSASVTGSAVLASVDLRHWAAIGYVPATHRGLIFLGVSGGKIHALAVAVSGSIASHVTLTPVEEVALRKCFVVEAGATNLFSAVQASCGDLTGWTAASPSTHSVLPTSGVNGGPCLRWQCTETGAGSTNRELSPAVTVVDGQKYIGVCKVKGTAPGGIIATLSNGNMTIDATNRYASLSTTEWTTVMTLPGTARGTSMRLNIRSTMKTNDVADVLIDDIQIIPVGAFSWHPGGEARANEAMTGTLSTAAEWAEVFSIYPLATPGQMSGTTYIRSWVADAANYLELYYNATDKKFYLQQTVAGEAQAAVATEASTFCKDAELRFAVVSTGDYMALVVFQGTADGYLTVDAAAFSALNSATITTMTGNHAGLLSMGYAYGGSQYVGSALDIEGVVAAVNGLRPVVSRRR